MGRTRRTGDVLDPVWTVEQLMEHRGLSLSDAIEVRAFGRWLQLVGRTPAIDQDEREPFGVKARLAGLEPAVRDAALAYARGDAGAARALLAALGETLPQ